MSENKIKMELVWIQNLKALITHGLFRTDERWKKIFIDKLDHIGALEKENAELRKALKPFAQSANEIEARYGKDLPDGQFQFPELTMGDFRRARSALRDGGEK